MDIHPPSGAVGSADVVTARLRSGTASSPRPSVWPLVSPIGGSPVIEQRITDCLGQAGLDPSPAVRGFGDLTINSDWDWMYDSPLDLLSALTQNQLTPTAVYFYQSGEPVNAETWVPDDFAEAGRWLPGQNAVLGRQVSGGPGIVVDQVNYRVSVDLAADPGLEFDAAGSAGRLRVLPNAAKGVLREAAGMGVGLAADPGLEFDGNNGVRVKPNAAKGIAREVAGVGVVVAADPGLEFDGNNGLRVKADAGGAIQRSTDGVGLVDGTADKQMLAWDHDPGEWDKILPDGVWLDVNLTTGKLIAIGPGPEVYVVNLGYCIEFHGFSLDAIGNVRWIKYKDGAGPVTAVGPNA